MTAAWNFYTAIEQIKRCGFECEAGPLAKNVAWAWLEKSVVGGPKYALGQRVDFAITAEVGGIAIANTVSLSIVGVRMESNASGLEWAYDLSSDPPGAYHYGTVNFRNVSEAKLSAS